MSRSGDFLAEIEKQRVAREGPLSGEPLRPPAHVLSASHRGSYARQILPLRRGPDVSQPVPLSPG